ncbi:MAG: hypothetical protein QF787_17340, partial [Nitrospinota bacterium]|nr:hypothetical protein [Nitrospinota bacterium]
MKHKPDTNEPGASFQRSEHAIIKSRPEANTTAEHIKCQSGHQNYFKRGWRFERSTRRWGGYSECPRPQILAGIHGHMKSHVVFRNA